MTPESDAKLRAAYPLVFSRRLMNDEPIRCGEGWYELLDKVCAVLDVLIAATENESHHYYAQQVKEKFGALRLYLSRHTAEMSTVIDLAERMSELVCDVCGQTGKPRSGDGVERPMLVRTRCDEHVNWFEAETGFAHRSK